MKKVDFDQYAANYNQLLREGTGFFTEDESYFARYKVALARELVTPAPRRILEFGCGIGRNIPFLREAFPEAEVMGSDVSAKSIEIARRENPQVSFWVDGTDEPARQEFDLVFVAGVFHHIPPAERAGASSFVAGRLARGGSVVVFEHNPYNPVTRKIVRDCPYDEGVTLLRPGQMRHLLEEAGLAVDRRGFSLFFPPKLKALASMEPWLAWLPLGGQYWVLGRKP
jgi:SAM-dependent methyltransferase